MIITRYITKEVVVTFISVTIILLTVALSNNFVSLLAKAAAGKLPVIFVFKIVALYFPEFLSNLIPLSLFIAILFAHGRMHSDSELIVLLTTGFNWSYLLKITSVLACTLAAIVALLTLWLVPATIEYREQLLSDGEAIGMMKMVTPGRFQTINNGQLVFYVEDIQGGYYRNVFIAEEPSNSTSGAIITAKLAKLEQVKDGKFYMILQDGFRYTGKPGSADYSVVKFAEYGREVVTESTPVDNFARLVPTQKLWNSTKVIHKVELQWRSFFPISVLILALLAVPLSKVSPREGRFAKFLPAIIIYIIYVNLATVVKRWSIAGKVSIHCMWMIHVVFVLLACYLILVVSGRFWQLKRA